ncbi:PucR family transcriptional regulator [Actinomadura sp. KC345]|uniref:helix-turn-helix domain-containing protein n=1 Tax=Actinomadura sp. KC345 TaxID=2530371 RepID=UPI00104A574E|nr:helix-turn-helix domain-containing protein [Actinomadura sp. KC345]TDC46878.1 PucR family transcriptional regulator [Actinomadura sp. KC345]
MDWLHQRIGAVVVLADGEGEIALSSGEFPEDAMAALRPLLRDLSNERLGAAAAQVGSLHVRCEALGRGASRPVLVVAGSSPLTGEAVMLASHTATVLDALRRIGSSNALVTRHARVTNRMRVAIFTALMVGDPALARRMTADAVPPLLEADRLRVLVLRCPSGDRARLAETRQDRFGYHGRGLLLHCPVYDDHLICLTAEDEDEKDEGGDGALEPLLRSWVRDNPAYALGISAVHPLHATEAAYDQARHALAVARHVPDRIAVYRGQATLARLLPRDDALAWAQHVLQPMGLAPRLTVEVLRLSLALPRSGVARLLGISRNTVNAHLRRAENLLGVDLQGTCGRAQITLALAITDPPPPHTGTTPGERGPAPSLARLLSNEVAVTWAHNFLKPLRDGGNLTVYETVRHWVQADTDAQRTARDMGISRNTVRARLRVAERRLSLDLLVPSPGIHDLVHALRIIGNAPDQSPPGGGRAYPDQESREIHEEGCLPL